MEPTQLLEELFDKKLFAVLRFFISNPNQEFYLREISLKTKVPLATTFRIINQLVKLEIVKLNQVRKTKLYSWAVNKNTKFIESVILAEKKTILESFIERIKHPEVDMIILHGEEAKDKANILVISSRNQGKGEIQYYNPHPNP
jgi:DNA-binding IclR family transcriptional regulator